MSTQSNSDKHAEATSQAAIVLAIKVSTTFEGLPNQVIECALAMLVASVQAQDAGGGEVEAFEGLLDFNKLTRDLLPAHCERVRGIRKTRAS